MKHILMSAALIAAMAGTAMAQLPCGLPDNLQSYQRPDVDVSGGFELLAAPTSYYSYEMSEVNTPDLAGKTLVAIEIDGFRNDDGTPFDNKKFYNFYCCMSGPELPNKSWENIAYKQACFYPNGKAYATFPGGVSVPEGTWHIGFFADRDNWQAKDTPVCKNGKGSKGGVFTRELRGSWEDRSNDYGPMPVKFYYVDSPADIPASTPSITLGTPVNRVGIVGANTDFQLILPVTNGNWVYTHQIGYKIKVDGVESDQFDSGYDCALCGGQTKNYPFTVPGISEEGEHSVEIIVNQSAGEALATPAVYSFTVNINSKEPEQPEGTLRASLNSGVASDNLGVRIEHIDACMRFNDPALRGMQVLGAQVSSLRQGGLSSFVLWHTPTLGGNHTEEVDASQFGDHVTGLFKTPVTITENGPFFGYSYDILSGSLYAIPVGGATGTTDGAYVKNKDGQWQNLNSYGSLTITLFVKGDVPEVALKLGKQKGNTIFVAGQPFEVKYEVVNYSSQPVKTIDYTYTIGSKQGSKTGAVLPTEAKCELLAPQTISIPFDPQDAEGLQQVKINVTKVNGVANTRTDNSSTCNLRFTKFLPTKRPLFEEYTGTGCGYCPRGMLGMSQLEQNYPEFIGAAWHKYNESDPMYVPQDYAAQAAGAPTANIDRGPATDPYYGDGVKSLGIFDNYEEAASIMTPVQVNVKTTWDANKENLKAEAITSFSYAETGKTYKVAFLLTEDGLHGTGGGWDQSNYYMGDPDDPADPMINLLNKSVANGGFDMSVFNHVLIDASAATGNGVEGSAITKVNPYENYGSEYTFNIKDNEITQNPDNIKVIALVIDNSGKVRNAIKVKAGEQSVSPFPEVGGGGEAPADDLIEFHYPWEGAYVYTTGGSGIAVGTQFCISMALSDSVMNVYKGYEVVGVRGYNFDEQALTFEQVKIHAYPAFTGLPLNRNEIYEHGIMADAAIIDGTLEGKFAQPIKLESGTPLFGYDFVNTEVANSPWPMALYARHAMGLYSTFYDTGNLRDTSKDGVAYISVLMQKPGATSVSEITLDGNKIEYYDLMGRRVDNPSHGIFIKKANGQAKKVIL